MLELIEEFVVTFARQHQPGVRAILLQAILCNKLPSMGEAERLTGLSRQRVRSIYSRLKVTTEVTMKVTQLYSTARVTYKKTQPSNQPTIQPSYVASKEADKTLASWAKRQKLPGKNTKPYLKTFDDMHTIDGLNWNSTTGIWAIVDHILTEWRDNKGKPFILAPTKLRMPSKSYPELKIWEVARSQIEAGEGKEFVPRRPKLKGGL